MVRITADEELRKKLLDFTEDIELCDEQGRILALVHRLSPPSDPSLWVPMTPEISQEEIERRLESHEKTYTTDEVIEYLEKL